MRQSHSSLNLFNQCPYRYYRERVIGDTPRASTPATELGSRVHSELETAVATSSTPEDYQGVINTVERLQARLKGATAQSERALELDADLEPGEGGFIGIIDLLIVHPPYAFVVDYKTGKRKTDMTQLERYALVVFQHHPDVHHIMTAFFWLRSNKIDWYRFERSTDLERIRFETEMAINGVDNALALNRWPKKTSGLCHGWCSVTDCEHFRSRKR